MIPLKKILFPADFSDRCRGAARAVRAIALRYEAEVKPLHVLESASPQEVSKDRINQANREMEKLIAGELSGCKVMPCVTPGDPSAKIVEHANKGRFDLIMMPTHGFGSFRQYLLGSVTAKVLHDAKCPVWTSAHLENWPVVEKVSLRNLLCGIDFGSRSTMAVRCALQLAAEFNAALTVAHAIPLFEALPGSQECQAPALKAAEEKVRRMLAELNAFVPIEILDGSPASTLSEAAERLNADLLIIGRTHVAADVPKLGSNAYAIIAHSPCPVLSI